MSERKTKIIYMCEQQNGKKLNRKKIERLAYLIKTIYSESIVSKKARLMFDGRKCNCEIHRVTSKKWGNI